MIAAVDVAYGPRGGAAACVLFRAFGDPAPASTHLAQIADVAEYEPGAFYKRELAVHPRGAAGGGDAGGRWS